MPPERCQRQALLTPLVPPQDLHFADAPHELPLAEGQAVPMRAWWRHWALEASPGDAEASPGDAAAADESPGDGGTLGDALHRGLALDGSQQEEQQQQQQGRQQQRQQQQQGQQQQRRSEEGAAQHAARLAAHQAEVQQQLAAGWGGRVIADWQQSLASLEDIWRTAGPFDGLLGVWGPVVLCHVSLL